MLGLFFIGTVFHVHAGPNLTFYTKVFPKISKIEAKPIPDPISDDPINVKILIAKNKAGKTLGYIREVTTSTGCNSACLPVIFTLFYDGKKNFKKLLSKKPGLTKINHLPFTDEDYFKLEGILLQNPKSFQKVMHPLEMVDAITSETKKEFVADVVKGAAYSSLRINLYNQQTLKELKKAKSY
jgi:hypothetical protein